MFSTVVYAGILLLLVYLPLKLLALFVGIHGGGTQLQVSYGSTELQLVLYVGIFHIVFLTVLEKNKDIIGHIEHGLIRHVAEMVGVERMIVPYFKGRVCIHSL